MRLTPGQHVETDVYFATYVDHTLRDNVSPNTIQHLRDFGRSLLGSSQHADTIVDEWLTERG